MSDHFPEIWKKRYSTNPNNQTNLYLEIRDIYLKAPSIARLNIKDKEDFFQEFYLNKIFHALSTGLAISSPSYDDMSVGQLIHMMKQYNISCYRKQKNKISSDQNNTDDIEELALSDPSINVYQQFSLDDMVSKAIFFIGSSEKWVQSILLKSAKGDRLSGNDFPRRAKLGLTLKQSFYTGAKSIDEYHQETIIGRWIIETYSNDVLPLSETFLAEVLKSLHHAALSIDKEDNI